MNDENLIPANERSKSEVRELGKIGGLKSGEVRRRKRDRREWSLLLGSLPVDTLMDNEKVAPVVKMMEAAGIGTEEQCWDAVEIAQQHRRAMEGDVASFREIGNLNGDIQRNVSLDIAAAKSSEQVLKDVFGDEG